MSKECGTTFKLNFRQGGTSFSSYKGSSPVNIGLEQADDGVVITVTDSGGTESAKIKDGVSVTHEWDGTTLNVTSASGTSSADLKGDDGVGIESIAQTTWSYADEGENIITVKTTDGKTDIFKIRNGSRGSQGERGPQGFQGLTGPAGPQGIQGIQGPRGIPGERGPQGERGATGARGEAGPAGPAGTSGVDGKDGRRGTTTYRITTKPAQRYIENNDFTSYYTISRVTVANEVGTNDFMVGDILMHESSLYPIVSTGPSDLFLDNLTDLRGERGYTGLTGERGPQGEPGVPGEAGQRGAGIYRISTAPNIASHYSTEKIRYSIKLETAASEAGVDGIMVGDSLLRGSLLYPVLYTDLVYAYLGEYVSLKGEPGTGGDGGGGAVLVVDTRSDSQEKSMTFAEALAVIKSGQSLMAYDTYQHQAYALQHWSDEKIVFVGRVTEYIMAESGVHRKLTYYNDNTLSLEKMNDDAISYGILSVNEDGNLVCDRTYMGLLNDDFSFGKVIALLRLTDEKVVIYYLYKSVVDESTGGVMALFGTPEGERIGFCDDESIVELPAVSGGGVQPDWNENDETSAAYVKNRPFYEYTEVTTTEYLLASGSYTSQSIPDYGGAFVAVVETDSSVVIANGVYNIMFDGIAFNNMQSYSTDLGWFIGNAALVAPLFVAYGFPVPDDTGEPFALLVSGDERWTNILLGTNITQSTTHDFSITYVSKTAEEVVVKLPEKYYDRGVGKRIGNTNEIFNDYDNNFALGTHSHAEGSNTSAEDRYSHAEGFGTRAAGECSHVEGNNSVASGYASHAEGSNSEAGGLDSHAEGSGAAASGEASHAEGSGTAAWGMAAHAEGFRTIAKGRQQHVQGRYNVEDDGSYAHIVGNGEYKVPSNAHTLDWEGNAWFAGDVYVGSTSGTNMDDGSKKLLTEEDLYGFMEELDAGFLKFITITGGTQEIVESRYTDVTVIKIVGATLSHSFEEIAAMDSMGLMPVIGMGGMWLMPSVMNAMVMTNYGTDANMAHVFTNICQFGAIDTSPRSEAHMLDNGEIYVYIGMSSVASTNYVHDAIEAAMSDTVATKEYVQELLGVIENGTY